jgi:hypothetical protein
MNLLQNISKRVVRSMESLNCMFEKIRAGFTAHPDTLTCLIDLQTFIVDVMNAEETRHSQIENRKGDIAFFDSFIYADAETLFSELFKIQIEANDPMQLRGMPRRTLRWTDSR